MKLFKVICLGFISLLFILFLSTPRAALADDCLAQTPTDAPDLYQISMASSSATLYFVQPSSQFDGYVISYGLTQGADAYSVSFPEGRLDGAVKYKVNDLFPNTNYFFKVRATNGCSAGPWSQTLGTNLKGAGSLPETGPNNTFIFAGIGGIVLTLVGAAFLLLLL